MTKEKQFKIIVERDEDGFFAASVPVLPGCYTQAKSISELTKRIRNYLIKRSQDRIVLKNKTKSAIHFACA